MPVAQVFNNLSFFYELDGSLSYCNITPVDSVKISNWSMSQVGVLFLL